MVRTKLTSKLLLLTLSIMFVLGIFYILNVSKLNADIQTILYQLSEKGSSINGTSMSYVIHTSDDKLIIIDGGNSQDDANYLLTKIKEITGDNIVKVDAWILTHPHNDHVNSFIMLMESSSDKITIDKLYYHFPSEAFMNTYGSASEIDTYNSAKNVIEKAQTQYGTNVIVPDIGDKFNIGSVEFEVLWTWDSNITNNPINESSLVFKAYTEGQTILFTGDIGPFASDKLLNMYGDKLKSDIVQMSHHGSNGLLQTAYNTINPYVCLWPTTKWVWEGTTPGANLTTLTTRAWMDALGVSQHYRSHEGDAILSFPMQFDVKLEHSTGYIAVNTNTKIYFNNIGIKDKEGENVYYEDALWSANSSNVVITADYISVLKPGIYKLTAKYGGAVQDVVIFAKDKDATEYKYNAEVFKLLSKEYIENTEVEENIVLLNDYETSENQAKLQVHENASHETVGSRYGYRALNEVFAETTEVVNTGLKSMRIEVRNYPHATIPLYTSVLFDQQHSTIGAKYYQVYMKYTGTTNVPIGRIKTNAYSYNAYGNGCDAVTGTNLANQKMLIQQNGNWVESTVLPGGYTGLVRFIINSNEQLASSRGFAFRFNAEGAAQYIAGGYLHIDSFSIVYEAIEEPETDWVKINNNSIYVNSKLAYIKLSAYIPALLKGSDFTLTGLDDANSERVGDNFVLTFDESVKTTYNNVSLTISSDFIDTVLGADEYNDLTEGLVMINDFETAAEISHVFIRECYKDEPARVQYAVVTDFGSSNDANTGSKAIYADIIAKSAATYDSAAFSHFLVEQEHSTVRASYYQLHIKYTGTKDLTIMSFACDAYQYTYAGYGQGPNAIKATSLGDIFFIQNEEGGWIEATKLPAGFNGYIRVAIPVNCQIKKNKGFTFRISDKVTGDTDGGQLIIDSFAIKKNESEVTDISVYKRPYKTEYNIGDKFNPSGLRFNVTLDSGITKVMRYETLSELLNFTPGLDSALTAQNAKVTVNYGTLSCDIEIAVGYKPTGDSATYAGSQLRSALVPYKNKEGVINEGDLRQGLRFCFDVYDIGDSIIYNGITYTRVFDSSIIKNMRKALREAYFFVNFYNIGIA